MLSVFNICNASHLARSTTRALSSEADLRKLCTDRASTRRRLSYISLFFPFTFCTFFLLLVYLQTMLLADSLDISWARLPPQPNIVVAAVCKYFVHGGISPGKFCNTYPSGFFGNTGIFVIPYTFMYPMNVILVQDNL